MVLLPGEISRLRLRLLFGIGGNNEREGGEDDEDGDHGGYLLPFILD